MRHFLCRVVLIGFSLLITACGEKSIPANELPVFFDTTSTLRLEAETAIHRGLRVETGAPGYSGTGYVTGFNTKTDEVIFEFTAPQGLYTLSLGYRTPGGIKGVTLKINELVIEGTFRATTEFDRYDFGQTKLPAGKQTIRVGGGWQFYDIDYLEVIRSETPKPIKPVPAAAADKNISAQAHQMLKTLTENYGKLTFSGQDTLNDFNKVYDRTGRHPAILSVDLMEYSPTRLAYGANPNNLVEKTIVDSQARGYMVSVSWHWNAPMNLLNSKEQPWWRGFYTEATTFDFTNALANIESPEYETMVRDIDAIAEQLKKFQAANVPILWRPLHECEGAWFWWGAQGPEAYKTLWRFVFNRLTQYHNIHNLLWVLTSEDPHWYPGDDVVDIVGVDAYPQDVRSPLANRWAPLLERFDGKKLLALTEFGGVPDISAMHELGVAWSYFASWNGDLGPDKMKNNELKRIYNHETVISLDEL